MSEPANKLQALLDVYIQLDPPGRAAFLTRECADDPSLRAQLLSLVSAYETTRYPNATSRPADDARQGSSFATELATGTVVGGRYRIERRLGLGGMGVVYEAHDSVRGTQVALKTLTRVDVEGIYRLKAEFRTLSDLAHPNLVRLDELVADQQGLWFFTMELVRGRTFLQYVTHDDATDVPGSAAATTSRVRFNERRLRAAFAQLAEGLTAIHAANKLHLDLKPSNVLVTDEGRVVILDFGLGRDLRRHVLDVTVADVVSGTPAYMAPEQVNASEASAASDWYAVGTMLYQALTGQLPFLGTTFDILEAKRREDVEPPASVAADIPADLNLLCAQLLARHPGDRPTSARVLQVLNTTHAASVAAAILVQRGSLVGRDQELAVLESLFRDVRHGARRLVFIRGPSGIGKSALMQAFLDHVRRSGSALVLEGRCYEREALPYKGFDAVVDALSRYLGRLAQDQAAALLPRDVTALTRLFPVLHRAAAVRDAVGRALVADPVEVRRRALDALKELLARISDRQHLVVAIDDLQWTDSDSARLLHMLVHEPNPPRMLVVGTYRGGDESRQAGLRHLLETRDLGPLAVTIDLDVLDGPHTHALARRLIGDRPDAASVAAKIVVESQGSPFFLEALAFHSFGSPAAVPDFATMMRDKTAALTQDARRVLELMCVFGAPVAQSLIAVAARADDFGAAVDALRASLFVRTAGAERDTEIAAFHDRIREWVCAQLSEVQLRKHHAALADALEAAPSPDAETLATHLSGAGSAARAAQYVEIAAQQASDAMAFDRAARLFRWALELVERNAESTSRLRRRLGDALKNAGRSAEAADTYRLAAMEAETHDKFELERLSAERLLICGRLDEGYNAITDLLKALAVRVPSSVAGTVAALLLRRARLRLRGYGFRHTHASAVNQRLLMQVDTCASLVSGLTWVDALRGASLQSLHLLLALRAGERTRIARALTHELIFRSMEGGPAIRRTEKLLTLTRGLVEGVDDPAAQGLLEVNHGALRYLQGRFKEAAGHLESAQDTLTRKCVGLVWELTNARLFWLLCVYFLGRIGELLGRFPELLRDAEEVDDRFAETVLRTRFAHLVCLARDDPNRALEEVRGAIGRWSHRGFHTEHGFALIGETESLLYAGRGADAYELVTRRWPALVASGVLRVIQLARVECHHLRGRTALAALQANPSAKERISLLRLAAADAKRIAAEQMPWSNPFATMLEAAIAASEGQTGLACLRLAAAEAAFDAADLALYGAAARRRRGELTGGDEGARLIASADAFMLHERLSVPARMTAMLAPGFG